MGFVLIIYSQGGEYFVASVKEKVRNVSWWFKTRNVDFSRKEDSINTILASRTFG